MHDVYDRTAPVWSTFLAAARAEPEPLRAGLLRVYHDLTIAFRQEAFGEDWRGELVRPSPTAVEVYVDGLKAETRAFVRKVTHEAHRVHEQEWDAIRRETGAASDAERDQRGAAAKRNRGRRGRKGS